MLTTATATADRRPTPVAAIPVTGACRSAPDSRAAGPSSTSTGTQRFPDRNATVHRCFRWGAASRGAPPPTS